MATDWEFVVKMVEAMVMFGLLPVYAVIGTYLGVKEREDIINAIFYRHETMEERLDRAARRFNVHAERVESAKLYISRSFTEELKRRDTDGIVRYWKSEYQITNNCFVL